MRVGVDHGVDVAQALAEALGTEIRRGVDLDDHLGGAELDAAAEALVPGVVGTAHGALASDDRHAVRCPRAKK